ncbi:hypothetical protein A2348_03895 [Candidatus Uhrbacteria bacterium RIFOXYB12_FULL_58_10]|uniref:Thioredoxin domain-containing protein n=1 Tax=Candidatus Uhrbacteria bacterium RIFOXYB2_FULL_57_15 TaxID=1802422 RepID=A0A1F7WA81_9BACT|nr:MAG: hypothetical protein A2348_03895 [Candidatus Uhrbacteria bacterium RIFOXYB12_FULL_58_10]OGL99107.1 MAG: hypothetical protein A2304_04560 [Candidatus Uhrbacteria bacterium RIFOXYB2_FULL_57_15]OGL99598.1 MAG: hypothetical protein A2501_00100 [Candidatus Uhrbacteria bacterium RIFOXYC12_FULL_57_11]
MKSIPSSYYLYGAAVIVVIGLFAVIVVNGIKSRVPSAYNEFAQCLADQGARMYGTWWCSHCQNQKDLFGSAFSNVDYVECSPGGTKTMSKECKDAGVEGYPTWIFADESKASGEQSLQSLSDKTSCLLPNTEAVAE